LVFYAVFVLVKQHAENNRKEVMNIKKPLAIAGIVSGIALTSLAGAGAVSAETTATNGPESLITKIAQKFNLKEEEVKAVFEEEHATRVAEHQQAIEDKLAQAVTDGKITSEQKDKILAKLKELQAEREANHDVMEDKTPVERKAAMEAKRDEIEKWAEENDIPTEYLRFAGGKGKHLRGPGHGDF
jgi:hypothetical protein